MADCDNCGRETDRLHSCQCPDLSCPLRICGRCVKAVQANVQRSLDHLTNSTTEDHTDG